MEQVLIKPLVLTRPCARVPPAAAAARGPNPRRFCVCRSPGSSTDKGPPRFVDAPHETSGQPSLEKDTVMISRSMLLVAGLLAFPLASTIAQAVDAEIDGTQLCLHGRR
jgi:hypothetical protein